MKAKIILNPYANRWNAGKRRQEAEDAVKSAGIDYDLVVSQHPGHGIDLASQALNEGCSPIIAAGGDSTYNEIINGMILGSGSGSVSSDFGILPMGTANDLADNLGIPKDLSAAAKLIAEGNSRKIDVCKVNDRYFINNSGLGFEPTVTIIQMNMKRLQGITRYLVATLVAVKQNPNWEMELEWDSGSYNGPVKLVSIGNNPRTGGIFYTVPNADPFDGKLSFVYGFVKTRGQILRLLPRLMKSGTDNYTQHPDVHEEHATWLKIRTKPPSPVHADGELFDKAVEEIIYKVYPGAISMLLPESIYK